MTGQVNKNNIPKVCIGMPVYNGEKYIKEALDSLLAQTFADFELIISDNASTDSTQEICMEYVSKDSRIHYFRQQENIGANGNFEYVLKIAKSDYFIWAACDDRWARNCFQEMTCVLDNDAGCGLVFSNFVIKNLKTGQQTFHKVHSSQSDSVAYNYILRILHMSPSIIYGMYRTDLIKNTIFEKFDFADVYFLSELSLKTKIKIVDDYLYIAGTKGERKPYSLSGNKIDRVPFLHKQFDLLKQNFKFPFNLLMFSFVCMYMAYNKIRLWRY